MFLENAEFEVQKTKKKGKNEHTAEVDKGALEILQAANNGAVDDRGMSKCQTDLLYSQ